MKFVPEEIIDKVIGELEVDGITESLIEDLKQSQPVVFSYLFSDSFDLSTQDEKEYLLYMVMVAWLSMMNPHKLAYGFAFNLPFAQVTAIVTMLMATTTNGYVRALFTRDRACMSRSM